MIRWVVHVPIDETFHAQRARYRLVFACEDCVYLDRAASRCAHGYPTAPHARAAFEAGSEPKAMFCKEFEIA